MQNTMQSWVKSVQGNSRSRRAEIRIDREPQCELRRAIMAPEPTLNGRPVVVRLVAGVTLALSGGILFLLQDRILGALDSLWAMLG